MNVQQTQQADLVRPFVQAWNSANTASPGREASQPVGNKAAQVIKQAFSSGEMVTLSVPESIKGAIRTMAEKTLSELPPNGPITAFDGYV